MGALPSGGGFRKGFLALEASLQFLSSVSEKWEVGYHPSTNL